MKRLSWSRKVALSAGAVLALIVALGALSWVAGVWTDYQWYASQGQQEVFWGTSLTQLAVWLAFATAGFLVIHASARAAWRVISEKPRLVRTTAFVCVLLAGALALAIGASTGRTGASRGVPALVAVLAYMVNGLAPLVSWLEPIQKLSPFYQYGGHDPLRNGVSGAAVAVAVLTVAGFVVIAIWGFRRRDVLA